MRFPEPISVQTLADRYQASIVGDSSLMATGINEIHKVQPGDIAFSDVRKYFDKTLKSAATVILLNEETECPPGKVILVVDNPFRVYDDIVRSYRPFKPITASIASDNEIHPSVIIEPGVVIGHDVKIGAHSHICANAVIGPHTIIGEHVVVGPGSLIGPDAFYFKKMPDGEMVKWRSGGRVILEDYVDIGAGCTVSKGVSGDTVIGQGTKLDCQVHIGHGVVVGKNCLLAAQVGIGGKTILGDQVVLYGQVGVAQAIEIGSGAVVLAKSGVSKSLEGGKTYFGIPADEVREKYRELASLRLLPDLLKKL